MSIVSKATVLQITSYNDDVKEFILGLDEFESFEAGQFLQLTLDNVTASENWPDSRTFSIASYLNENRTIRLIIKRVGSYTSRIFNELILGSECHVKYAYGDFLLPLFDNDNLIHCIAGGTGIAPFLSFMESLSAEGGIERLFIYYSVRKEQEFVNYKNIKSTLGDRSGFYCTRENSSLAQTRHIQMEDIINNVKNIADEHFYVCGSTDFINFFKNNLEDHGALNIYSDEWD